MAQFDSDDSDAVALTAQEKLTVEGTIRITDQVVAAKEREIAELKKQTGAKGTSASREEALDRDEIIRGERENLRRLQEEWREKLRKAEVDISVERAKIARERLNLQEKLHAIEAERAELAAQQGDEQQADKSKPRSRNRWMARLGLKEDDA